MDHPSKESGNYPTALNEWSSFLWPSTRNVQELINQVANNSSLVASVIAGLKVESDQITALQAQIAGMTPGQPVDAEDLAAIQKAVTDLQATNTALGQAIPASTPGV